MQQGWLAVFGASIVYFNLQGKRISVIPGIITQYCRMSRARQELNGPQMVQGTAAGKLINDYRLS